MIIVLTDLFSLGQCSITFTSVNSSWCACTGYVSASPTGTAPFVFHWSTGDTTNFIDSLCQGTYTLTITDSLGCIATDSTVITQADSLTFFLTSTAASSPTSCDACIYVNTTGGCPPFLFNWIPYDPIALPCSGCPGVTYTVEISDNCGCIVQGSITPDTVPVGLLEQIEQNILTYQIFENTIVFSMPIKDLKIFDLLGHLLLNLTDREFRQANLPDMINGLYIMSAKTLDGKVLMKKILVNK